MEKYESILEGISPKRKFLIDVGGNVYNVNDYIKHYHEGMRRQMENNFIPSIYEKPLGVQLELTYKCNQRCIHCYNQSGMDNNDKEGLTIQDWKEVARQAGDLGVFQCVISGGEPTVLGDELFEIMDILDSYDIKFVVISNGMLIDEKTIKKFRKYKYSWFQISIDGSRPELHDTIRGVKSFEKAIKAANLVKEAGMPLVIAHSVMKINKDYIEEMLDMCYLLGAAKVITGPFSYMGRAVLNSELISLTDKEINEVYDICDKKAREFSGRMQIAVAGEEVTSLRVKLAEPNSVLLIRPNGDVKFDCVSPFKIGNIKENTLHEIWSERGRYVYSNPRLINYVSQIKSTTDMLHVEPRVNVDPDELLEFSV